MGLAKAKRNVTFLNIFIMTTINAHTKIATILKQHPDALDAIVGISPKFKKLRNPVIRKLMAGRASIAMASKIGGCTLADFYKTLQPLGFECNEPIVTEATGIKKKIPDFMQNIHQKQIIEFDVRSVLDEGNDPLQQILTKTKSLQQGQVLKIINSFEPTPLMLLLTKQGFHSYAETIADNLVYTYFYKTSQAPYTANLTKTDTAGNWEDKLQQYAGKMETIDVRLMEMPQPMLTILEALKNLPPEKALFVYHKRIPVFLLPELADRKLDYRIKEICDGEVQLLIFKA